MRFEAHSAGGRDENTVRPRLNENFGVRVIQTDDVAGKGRWGVDKIPIVL